MNYFSMFSGIGGFELGIQRGYMGVSRIKGRQVSSENEELMSNSSGENGNGREQRAMCVGFSEVNKYAIQVYEQQFKGHKNYGDATAINAAELPDFDLLVGGFPCQAFSIAGKRKGFDEARGTLFFDIARILAVKRPRCVLLENVKGLLSHDNGKTFSTIIGILTDIGYHVQWQVLNSKDFGVPQNRERVFIVGHLGEGCSREVFPIGEANTKTLNEITSGESQGYRTYDTRGLATCQASQAGGLGAKTGLYAIPVLTPDREEKRQNGRRMKDDGEPSFTLTSQDKHGVFDGYRIRRLTPTECERLQGFPDGWTSILSDSQRYKCLGNAVTVNVIEAIITSLTTEC